MKILIAEDNGELQTLISLLMDAWDYDFDLAANGRQAVELAKTNDGAYDLCLMDIEMPIMNGFEATRIIRQQTRYFPVMAVTGKALSPNDYGEAGIDDWLPKPYAPSDLYAKISELTVKVATLKQERQQMVLRKELPMDADELKELRELDKQGLAKFSLIDSGYKFVVHKNLQNKISHDFIAHRKQLSEFLDRSTDDPGIIHLYALNLRTSKRHIVPEMLERMVKEEDDEMRKYTTKAEYPEKEELRGSRDHAEAINFSSERKP